MVLVQLLDIREERCCLPPTRSCVAAGELEGCKRTPQTAGCTCMSGTLGDGEQLGDLPPRSLCLAPVRVDLGKEHQTERLGRLATGLARQLDHLVADPCSRVPVAGRQFHSSQEEQIADDSGISPLGRVGDQVTPDGARLLVTVGSAEQARERARRAAVRSDGPLDLERTVEQITTDATGAPERELSCRREAGGKHLGIVELLGERERRFRIPRPLSVVTVQLPPSTQAQRARPPSDGHRYLVPAVRGDRCAQPHETPL